MFHRMLVVALSLLAGLATPVRAARPNIVLIFADDLGWGDLSCYGNTKYTTPHLDRMATEGARLTRFYVPLPFCAPSRATLLTGRYPFRHGLWQNPAPDDQQRTHEGLAAGELTIAEVLKDAGYATACIGKWHLGHEPQFMPRTQGFDEYFGIPYSNDMRPVQLVENEQVAEYPVEQSMLTQRYTRRAVDFIERSRDRAFFLYLPHAMPHKPFACSDEFRGKSGAGLYGDAVIELDWGVGQVLDKLKQAGLDEQTFVFFSSDNGPWFGGSTNGLRGMKTLTWEGGLRVPGIARWPGHVKAGQVIETPCATVDVFPTILAAAGLSPPGDRKLDGIDLLPYLREGKAPPDRPIFGTKSGEIWCVMQGRYKLHLKPPGKAPSLEYRQNLAGWVDPRAPDGTTIIAPAEQATPRQHPGIERGDESKGLMLFDLRNDPAEQHDVAGDHPEIVRQLQADAERALRGSRGR